MPSTSPERRDRWGKKTVSQSKGQQTFAVKDLIANISDSEDYSVSVTTL